MKLKKYNEYINIINQDIIDGEVLDTDIEITEKFAVAGSQLEEFAEELKKLINKYRI